MLAFLRTIKTLVKFVAALSFVLMLYAWFKKGELPRSAAITLDLAPDPEQTETDQETFRIDYRGSGYLVEPVANYTIRGLVVSHNDITAFWDMYHDEDSVDLKDLCLIWGDNLEGDIQNRVKFYNESVSCHWSMQDQETYSKFRNDQISNNHLIADDEVVRKRIREAKVGDQIEMQGMLVNYSPTSNPDLHRRSSLTRKDTAGFACEVIFVESFHFIKKAPRFWFNLHSLSKRIFSLSLLSWFSLFLVLPYLEYKYDA